MPRAEEDVSSRAKDQQFGLDLHLHPSFVNASSEGSNATSTKFSRAGYIDRYKSTSPVKSVLSGNSKLDKTKILMANGSLMKVESIAECILQYF